MHRIGFDNAKYVKLQSQNIRDRISQFGKLYLEFGGKLFDDYHASRVLPGFEPDSKVKRTRRRSSSPSRRTILSAPSAGATWASPMTRTPCASSTPSGASAS